MEAIQNMTTVASLNLEQGFIKKFDSYFQATKQYAPMTLSLFL